MLSIGLAGALAALVVLAHALWSFQSLGSSAERTLAAKDVVADVLPPPLYLVEMRLVLSQAVEGSLTPAQARAEVERLATVYEERLAHWLSHDAYGLQQQLTGPAHASAQRLIGAARNEVLARLEAGDPAGARRGLEVVQAAYLAHRHAVDATVVAGRQVADSAIADFDATRNTGRWLMPLIALALLAAAAWCYVRASRSILRPLRDSAALADRVASGDLRPAPPADRDDELGTLQAALRDMTAKLALNVHDLEQARDAAQAGSQAKADFLANMSHEIRTPMNAVLGLTHLVLRTPLDERQRDYLGKIDEAGKSLLRIINDILDFSKIEAGKLELERAPFELDRLLEQVTQVVGPLVDGKSVEMVVQHDDAVPNMLHGDALRLKQVLINLASNAAKFTERGEVTVGVALQAREGDTLTLAFTVRDTGIGMTEAEQKRLFEAFVQADSSTSRRFGGTGLGLVISRRLVQLMGGELTLRSAKGQGSEFRFTLTLQRSSAPAPLSGSTEERARLMRHRLDGLSAMVVDDNFSARMTLASMLRAFGMKVTEADSGQAALEAAHRAEAAREPFAVALVDWRMPEMDGFVVIDELRGAHPSAQTAFIMVSAYDRELVEREVPQHAPDGLLQKPVTPSTLLDALYTLLSTRDAQAADGHAPAAPPTATMPAVRLAGHVLLVEDNALNQLVASELLRDCGLEVSIADDGPRALQALKSLNNGRRFDAVLMDLQMPGMDGFETTRQIRAMPACERLPVIAMTAHAFAGECERCLASGMDDYVSKPIDPALLAACLLRWLPKAA